MPSYPRYMTAEFDKFDVRDVLKMTEEMVCGRYDEKKYLKFSKNTEYGGTAAAYVVGCVYRCYFCAFDQARDFPENTGTSYTALQAFNNLKEVGMNNGLEYLQITGGDAAIGKVHLLTLLEMVEKSEFKKIYIETTGASFALEREYAEAVSRFKKAHVVLFIKAGYAENFTKRTGAREEDFGLAFAAAKNLADFGAEFHMAATTDKRVMKWKERDEVMKMISELSPELAKSVEEVPITLNEASLARAKHAGMLDKIAVEPAK